MGRFERKIRKKLQQDVPPFDQWFEEHRDQLAKFDRPQESAEDQGEVRAKRRVPTYAWIVGATVLLLTALALMLAFLLPREQTQPQIPSRPSIPDLTFGDEGVYTTALSEDELQAAMQRMPTLAGFAVTGSQKVLRQDDDSMVMVYISGEQLTDTDYYLIEAQIEYNENYIFPEKPYYEDLEHTLTVGDTQISYELMGDAEAELKEFYVLSQNDNATIYWTVSCFGGEIDEWLQMTFAE